MAEDHARTRSAPTRQKRASQLTGTTRRQALTPKSTSLARVEVLPPPGFFCNEGQGCTLGCRAVRKLANQFFRAAPIRDRIFGLVVPLAILPERIGDRSDQIVPV